MVVLLLLVLQSSEFAAIAPDNVKLANKLKSEFVKVIGQVKASMK
jgi:hypothetical protein